MDDGMVIPDIKERELALDPERSFIVEAPAGSGKTELLMRRYLRLLATVKKPEEILAITFTRKAAGEMHSRIMDALIEADRGLPPEKAYRVKTFELSLEALARDKELGWGLIENPSRLRVQTIDSLSSMIVARMPVLSGLGKRPVLIEEPEEVYSEAARRTIEKVEEDSRDGECVREALKHLDNFVPKLTDRLVAMLKKRDQWLRLLGTGRSAAEDKKLREGLESPVRAIVESVLGRLSPLFDDALSAQLVKSARFAASVLLNDKKISPITKLADLEALPGSRAENFDKWRAISTLLMTDTGDWRSPGGVNKRIGFPTGKEYEGEKNDFKALLDSLSGCDELEDALATLKTLPSVRYDEQEWSILVALLHLLPVAAAELAALFAKDGLLDFQSLTMAAGAALGDEERPTELLLSIDMKLRHLLVDEFQDTSKSHFELIKSLVSGFLPDDGRTLFIVGDPMQSIYLFRDADVGLFLKAANKGVANLELTRLKLTTNFRSLPGIVEWVNSTFAPAFPDDEDISRGSVRYTPSHAAVANDTVAKLDMRIYSSLDNELEAADVADRVEEIRAENNAQESIAILVRSRGHLTKIVDELKARDIDFRTNKLDPLIECSVVQDLMSLIRALKHPFDRVAWLSILRAPWCGLSLIDIHSLTLGSLKAPFIELMSSAESVAKLSPDGRERIGRVAKIMTRALSLRGTVCDRTLLESLWIELGGPACLAESGEMENAASFFDLLDKFLDTGVPFSVEALEYRVKKLYATHNGSTENLLDIMTIHNAKGLEFDHLLIPGLGKKPKADTKELLSWTEKDGKILLAPIEGMEIRDTRSLYSYIMLLKAEKFSLELVRLFYVACTRARLSLTLYGHATSIKEAGDGVKEIAVDSRSLLSSIKESIDISMLKEVDVSRSEAEVKEDDETHARINLRRLGSSWELPEQAPALECREFAMIPELIEGRETRPSFDWATEERKHIGTVLHRYFCRVITDGLESWDSAKAVSEKTSMEAMLRGLGLSKEKAVAGAGESVKILERALSDEDGRFVLAGHKEGESEFQITGIIDGVIEDVRIDRTFVDAQGVRWIVDYKTGSHGGGDMEEFLVHEKERYAPQLRKYKELLASLDDAREIKCALYYPALGRLVPL